jgi:hypothetical protein
MRGFRVSHRQGFREVIMSDHGFKGSGLAHVVTAAEIILIDGEFILAPPNLTAPDRMSDRPAD